MTERHRTDGFDPKVVAASGSSDLLELVVVDAHEGNLRAAALVELVATGLTAETLEEQLSAEVTEGQRKEGLPHLGNTNTDSGPRRGGGDTLLYRLCSGWVKVVAEGRIWSATGSGRVC